MSAKLVGSSVVRFFALMQLSFALYWVVGTAISSWAGFFLACVSASWVLVPSWLLCLGMFRVAEWVEK